MPFPAILFDETQHVLKTSTTGHVPVCYKIINLFIKLQNFLFMFFIYRLKGFYLIVTVCDGLLMLFLDLFNPCIKSMWYDVFQDVVLKYLALVFSRVYNDIKGTIQRKELIRFILLIFWPRPTCSGCMGRVKVISRTDFTLIKPTSNFFSLRQS